MAARWLSERLGRAADNRRQRILFLLAERPMSQSELGQHFLLPLDLGWHLRELRELGLIALNHRAGRYHLVWPAVEELAIFFAELTPDADLAPAPAAASAPAASPAPASV
jgi:DNA-binding transcriptional ArsR family regulator